MSEIITPLLTIQNQIKIFHWQTRSFAQHKSLDEAYSAIGGFIDEFVETYMGIFGRIYAQEGDFNLQLTNIDYSLEGNGLSNNMISFIDGAIEYLKGYSSDSQLRDKTDLLNIRDEMVGTLNQLKYLLTLN
jgi:hypothetical protein